MDRKAEVAVVQQREATAIHDDGTVGISGLDLVVTPERVIDCRPHRGPRPTGGIRWAELTDEKIAAIPLLAALRP